MIYLDMVLLFRWQHHRHDASSIFFRGACHAHGPRCFFFRRGSDSAYHLSTFEAWSFVQLGAKQKSRRIFPTSGQLCFYHLLDFGTFSAPGSSAF